MKRFKLEIAYDGTHYCGWQIQPNGITVEEVINKHLSELLREEIKVIGASRTDSGVHALGNVAVFDSETKIPGDKLSYALNQRLPSDIVIQASSQVADDFHPRYCDSRKTYEYQIYNAKFENPLYSRYSHFVFLPLRIAEMKKAADIIKGEHDFKSFCSSRGQALTTVRTIYELDVTKEDHMVKIKICGNGFLYNMVRIIVGTLIKVGLGVYPPEYVQEILDAKDRTKAGPKVPAKGLKLVGIEYL
jgi:tRNA pseudouridine38-40 synthase